MESACNEGAGGSGGAGGAGGGGGAGGANDGTCSLGNGWCTRTCTCAGCEIECTGNPPPSENENGRLCDLDYCSLDYWRYGGCEIKDGTCDYRVECGDSPKLIGTCPDSN
ncbi:hypothetical protein [Polyangium sp. 15x6]|uniref:hypothetical protein n=1 Tax=Polyangium sp. 15x6 TaxID=3042687 RepID=UPI00249BEF0B|nr:hypothetical protein [Polyangium sp. 15x6]MDI3290942.1 hypothetical protein [Polyangium sp. 15x6]